MKQSIYKKKKVIPGFNDRKIHPKKDSVKNLNHKNPASSNAQPHKFAGRTTALLDRVAKRRGKVIYKQLILKLVTIDIKQQWDA